MIPTELTNLPRAYTTGQIAKICGLSRRKIVQLLESGRLPFYRVPGSEDRRVTREALVEFLKAEGIWESVPKVSRMLLGLETGESL